MPARKFLSFLSLAAGALALAASGCSDDNNLTLPFTPPPTGIRSFNANVCTTTPNMKVNFILGSPTASPLNSQPLGLGNSTLYNSSVPISASVNEYVTPVGSTTPLASANNAIRSGVAYTLAALGDCTQTTGSPLAPALTQFTDNFPLSTSLGINQAALRVINLAPAASTSQYYYVNVYNGLTPITGLTNIAYGAASQYAVVLVGQAFTLTVHNNAGGILPLTTNETTYLTDISLVGGKSYTLFVIGEANNTSAPFDARLLQED